MNKGVRLSLSPHAVPSPSPQLTEVEKSTEDGHHDARSEFSQCADGGVSRAWGTGTQDVVSQELPPPFRAPTAVDPQRGDSPSLGLDEGSGGLQALGDTHSRSDVSPESQNSLPGLKSRSERRDMGSHPESAPERLALNRTHHLFLHPPLMEFTFCL